MTSVFGQSYIMIVEDKMRTTITKEKSISVPTELVPKILGKRAHSPTSLKTLPYVKPNYRGKNPAGGRKAVFSQSMAYAHGYTPNAIRWGWKTSVRFELP